MGFETGAGEFMQNSAAGTYSAAQMRRSVFAWAARAGTTVGSAVANTPGAIAGGLFSATDMQLSAAVSGLVVYTSTGDCLIPGQEANNQGGYHGLLSSQNSTTLATANGSNPRIDLICATSADPGYTIPSGGTSGYVTIQAVTGTPTSGATLSNLSGAPSLPLSSLLLGYVLVPAAATNLTSGDIANKATLGLPVQSLNGRAGAVLPASGDYAASSLSLTWTVLNGLYASGWSPGSPAGGYMQNAIGEYTFEGVVTNSGSIASGTTMFTMPSGLRPAVAKVFPVTVENGTGTIWDGWISVNTNGTVLISWNTTANTSPQAGLSVFLDPVRYVTV